MRFLLHAGAMLRTSRSGILIGFAAALTMSVLPTAAAGLDGTASESVQSGSESTLQEQTDTPQNFGLPKLPPAQVLLGTPLKWREIIENRLGSSFVVCGSFDSDSDDEILAIQDARVQELYANIPGAEVASSVSELQGGTTPANIVCYFYCPGASAWDYDGDGIAEVVPFDSFSSYFMQAPYFSTKPEPPAIYKSLSNPDDCTPVLSLDGSVSAALPGGGVWTNNLVGDFDGDCIQELVLEDYSKHTGRPDLIFYSTGGYEIGRSREVDIEDHSPAFYSACSADIDGDGRAEIVMPALGTREGIVSIDVHAVRYDMQTQVFHNTGLSGNLCARDINCDGRDEVISASGLADLCAATMVRFSYPGRAYANTNPIPECVAGDFDRDGVCEIAVLDGVDNADCCLFLFDLNGTCTYYEEFGDNVVSMFCAEAEGGDYLVVCFLGGRVISFP